MKPWELIRYTWADVMKMILGIQWKDAGIRRAALLIHWSLVDKKSRVGIDKWPLPFDDKEDDKTSTFSRLKQRQLAAREKYQLELKQNNHA